MLWVAGAVSPAVVASDTVPYRLFAVADGLTSTTVKALAQTSDGVLWIGTSTGVFVYDGHTFHSVPLPDSIGARSVAEIQPMPDGSVWVAPNGAGAVQLTRHGVLRSMRPRGAGTTVHRFLLRRDTLHLVTRTAVGTLAPAADRADWTALKYDVRAPARVTRFPYSGTGAIDAALSPDGTLWILDGHRGPARVDPRGRVTFTDVPRAKPGPRWWMMRVDRTGRLLLTRDDTLYRFDPETEALRVLRSGVDGPIYLGGTLDAPFVAWERHVMQYEPATGALRSLVRTQPGLPDLSPFSMLRDREGCIWIGMRNGLLQLPHPTVRHVRAVDDVTIAYTGHFLESAGHLWARTWGSGLVQLRPERTVQTPDGRTYWSQKTVSLDGDVHARSGDAWYRWTPERGWQLVTIAEHSVRGFVGPDGVGYFWHDNGLFRHAPDPDADPVQLASWAPEGRDAHMVAMAPDTSLFVRHEDIILRVRRTDGYPLDTLAHLPADLADARGRYMQVDGHGSIWMALYQAGLVRVDPNGSPLVQRVLDGVPMENIRIEGDSLVLASSRQGLYLVDPHTGRILRHLTESDGLHSNQVGAAHLMADTLYVGHPRGLTLLPTRTLFDAHRSPTTILTALEVNLDTRSLAGDSVLAAGERSVGFSFAGTALARPEQVGYEYRLLPRDTTWHATPQSFTRYVNLDPGSYRFEVRARLGAQPPGRPAAYAFVIPPHVYETWWFWSLCGVALVGLLVAGVRWREQHLRRRQRVLEAAVQTRTEALTAEKTKTEDQAERLVELDETKNRLFANVSHEFRTPLALLLQPLRTALRETSGSPVPLPRRHVQMMRDNAQRLRELIDQLLDLATLQAGHMTLDLRRGNIAVFVERVADSFASLARAQDLTLEVDRSNASLETSFDPDKLEKVFGNLLSNALKFTPEGGRITVTVDRVADQAVIRVRDTGIGISDDEQASIFDRFHQTDDASTRQHEGTGLGLAMVHEFVELHDGQIEVDSTPEEGSTFTVRLPIRRDPDVPPIRSESTRDRASPPEPSAADPSRAPSVDRTVDSGPRPDAPVVLVVEDNPAMRRYVRETLAAAYTVLEAEDGVRGWKRVQEDGPDLVLCDVMMPEMDGYELCRRIKQHDELRTLPVILLTARAGTDDAVKGLQCGADDVVTKPFDARELLRRIDNHLTVRELLRERYEEYVHLEGTEGQVSEDDVPFLKQVLVAIERHLGDPDFTVERLAEAVALSRRHLSRRLKATVGETASAFVRRYRIERAMEFLDDDSETIAEVAYAVGFRSPSHFTQVFREHVGCAPSDYVEREA